MREGEGVERGRGEVGEGREKGGGGKRSEPQWFREIARKVEEDTGDRFH